MSLVDRIGRLLRANLNDLLARVEDPEKILNQALLDMKAAYRAARQQVAEALAEEAKLVREAQAYEAMAERWREKARQALDAGEEALAKAALRKALRAEALAKELRQQLGATQEVLQRLRGQLDALRAKIDEAEGRKKLLLAKKQTYEAAEAVRRMHARLDAHPAVEAFDTMAQSIEAMGDRYEALSELDEVEALDAMEEEARLEAALAALKQEAQA